MEIVGNDNRIRALFSELRVADVQAAPGFTAVWHRAEARSPKPRRAFNFSFAAVTALLALTVGSLAVWSLYLNRSQARYQAFAGLQATDLVVPEKTTNGDVTTSRSWQVARLSPGSRATRANTRNQLLLAKQKKSHTGIDTWQSPTAALLTSPAERLFKSVPQLDENASELKSFLPARSNEKEK